MFRKIIIAVLLLVANNTFCMELEPKKQKIDASAMEIDAPMNERFSILSLPDEILHQILAEILDLNEIKDQNTLEKVLRNFALVCKSFNKLLTAIPTNKVALQKLVEFIELSGKELSTLCPSILKVSQEEIDGLKITKDKSIKLLYGDFLNFQKTKINGKDANEYPHILLAIRDMNIKPELSSFVYELLKIKMLDLNISSLFGVTPLISAASNMCTDVVIALTRFKNIKVNAQNGNGFTALMYSVLHNDIKAAEALLQVKDISIYLQNNQKKSALTIAREKGYTEILRLLEDHIAQNKS